MLHALQRASIGWHFVVIVFAGYSVVRSRVLWLSVPALSPQHEHCSLLVGLILLSCPSTSPRCRQDYTERTCCGSNYTNSNPEPTCSIESDDGGDDTRGVVRLCGDATSKRRQYRMGFER